MRCGWRKNIPAMKCRAGWVQMKSRIREMHDMSGPDVFHGQAQDAVIRAKEIIAFALNKQRLTRAAYAGVDNCDMNCPRRKIFDRVAQSQCADNNILGWNSVRYVNDARLRIDTGDDALHNAAEGILMAEICGESNNHAVIQENQPAEYAIKKKIFNLTPAAAGRSLPLPSNAR